MIVRALDSDGDWLFGKGKNDYLVDLAAVTQLIQTRLASFLGDCFFAADEGIDWFALLGGKNPLALNLDIKTTILGTPNVTGILQLDLLLNAQREFSVAYKAQTTFSQYITDNFVYDTGTI